MGTSPFEKPPKEADKARSELTPASHEEDLFDTNEDVHGARRNEATGEDFDNSVEEAVDAVPTVIDENNPVLQTLGKGKSFEQGNDAAGKWLRKNDPKNKN